MATYPTIPGTTTSILTKPSKMRIRLASKPDKLTQIYSFGLTAGKTCPGATTKENHKCADCYAMKHSYLYQNVVNAQKIRTFWTRKSHRRGAIIEYANWLSTMMSAIEWSTVKRNVPYFRIHDSGDFNTEMYIESWIMLATEFSTVRFWAPTSSYPEGANDNAQNYLYKLLPHLLDFAKLPNVSLRPSAREKGSGHIINIPGFAAGTGVMEKEDALKNLNKDIICPSSTTNNMCDSCTACWDEPEISKYYIEH